MTGGWVILTSRPRRLGTGVCFSHSAPVYSSSREIDDFITS